MSNTYKFEVRPCFETAAGTITLDYMYSVWKSNKNCFGNFGS